MGGEKCVLTWPPMDFGMFLKSQYVAKLAKWECCTPPRMWLFLTLSMIVRHSVLTLNPLVYCFEFHNYYCILWHHESRVNHFPFLYPFHSYWIILKIILFFNASHGLSNMNSSYIILCGSKLYWMQWSFALPNTCI